MSLNNFCILPSMAEQVLLMHKSSCISVWRFQKILKEISQVDSINIRTRLQENFWTFHVIVLIRWENSGKSHFHVFHCDDDVSKNLHDMRCLHELEPEVVM